MPSSSVNDGYWFEGFGEIYDESLGLGETWAGNPPRYGHQATLNRLCNENDRVLDRRIDAD
jgi:hypothetical protein